MTKNKLPSGTVLLISRSHKRNTVAAVISRRGEVKEAVAARPNCTVWHGKKASEFKDLPPEVAKALFKEFTGSSPARFESRIRMAERVFDLVLEHKRVAAKERKPKPVIGVHVPADSKHKSKIDRLIEMLEKGCTIAEACKALDWERNTVRHSIYGPIKSKGYVVDRLPSPTKGASREYLYKIVSRAVSHAA